MFSEYEAEMMVSCSDYMELDLGLNNLFTLSLTVITFGPNSQITAFSITIVDIIYFHPFLNITLFPSIAEVIPGIIITLC